MNFGQQQRERMIKMCKYCDDDRIIEQAAIYFGESGELAQINSEDELIVSIEGKQMNIPIYYCPFCGNKLEDE